MTLKLYLICPHIGIFLILTLSKSPKAKGYICIAQSFSYNAIVIDFDSKYEVIQLCHFHGPDHSPFVRQTASHRA